MLGGRRLRSALAMLAAFGAAAATTGAEEWSVDVPMPARHGAPQPPGPAVLWLPDGLGTARVRGLYYPGNVIIEKKLAKDSQVRAALAQEKMGILWYPIGSSFIKGEGTYLEGALAAVAKKSGHPEVQFAPMLTAGHSAAGLFCRNVAYWKPHRVIGVVMIKSGNFHHAIEDTTRSLQTVPLIHFSGEFEEYGPEGGDLGRGLRSEYVTVGTDARRRNQTQWVMTRMQMLDRRRKNADNVWSLVVHRGGGHTAWSGEMTALFIQYLHSLAACRIPKGQPDGKTEVRCIPMHAGDGWLYDADIKNPRHKPAPYARYDGDKKLAFWAPDEKMAMAIWSYHQKEPWSHPDPAAAQPVEKRFYPPPILRDFVDGPPPAVLKWAGGNGAWDANSPVWLDGGRKVAWDTSRQAVFEGGVSVTVPASRTCTGLVIGKGCTLDLGESRLHVRWCAELADGATLRVRLHPRSPRGVRWGAAVTVACNATVGGALIVDANGELREGEYGVLGVQGVSKGDFAKVALPKGCTGRWIGTTYAVIVPHVPTLQEIQKRQAEQRRRKETELNRKFGLPGLPGGIPPADPGPPPDKPPLKF